MVLVRRWWIKYAYEGKIMRNLMKENNSHKCVQRSMSIFFIFFNSVFELHFVFESMYCSSLYHRRLSVFSLFLTAYCINDFFFLFCAIRVQFFCNADKSIVFSPAYTYCITVVGPELGSWVDYVRWRFDEIIPFSPLPARSSFYTSAAGIKQKFIEFTCYFFSGFFSLLLLTIASYCK
jgi:hypothetical protein